MNGDQIGRLEEEITRLRARIAELETAGGGLADAVELDRSGNYGQISSATDDALSAWQGLPSLLPLS